MQKAEAMYGVHADAHNSDVEGSARPSLRCATLQQALLEAQRLRGRPLLEAPHLRGRPRSVPPRSCMWCLIIPDSSQTTESGGRCCTIWVR